MANNSAAICISPETALRNIQKFVHEFDKIGVDKKDESSTSAGASTKTSTSNDEQSVDGCHAAATIEKTEGTKSTEEPLITVFDNLQRIVDECNTHTTRTKEVERIIKEFNTADNFMNWMDRRRENCDQNPENIIEFYANASARARSEKEYCHQYIPQLYEAEEAVQALENVDWNYTFVKKAIGHAYELDIYSCGEAGAKDSPGTDEIEGVKKIKEVEEVKEVNTKVDVFKFLKKLKMADGTQQAKVIKNFKGPGKEEQDFIALDIDDEDLGYVGDEVKDVIDVKDSKKIKDNASTQMDFIAFDDGGEDFEFFDEDTEYLQSLSCLRGATMPRKHRHRYVKTDDHDGMIGKTQKTQNSEYREQSTTDRSEAIKSGKGVARKEDAVMSGGYTNIILEEDARDTVAKGFLTLHIASKAVPVTISNLCKFRKMLGHYEGCITADRTGFCVRWTADSLGFKKLTKAYESYHKAPFFDEKGQGYQIIMEPKNQNGGDMTFYIHEALGRHAQQCKT